MTTSSITSIEKFVLLKGFATEVASRSRTLDKKPTRSSDGGLNLGRSKNYTPENDRYENRIGSYDQNEARLVKQNHVALTVRTAEYTMQQIGIRINQMEDSLNALVKQYPPYPPGSEERIALLRKVNAFRKQIEELTFPRLQDENTGIQSIPNTDLGLEPGSPTMESTQGGENGNPLPIKAGAFGSIPIPLPELAEDAPDKEIEASIVRLRQTGAFIHRQRNELKSGVNLLFRKKDAINDNQVAEFKSLFVGKHLSRQPNVDITGTPSILTGYLN